MKIHFSPELLWGGHVAVGTTSWSVRRIQEWLTFHGHHVTIDGVFGRKTQQALADFLTKPVQAVDIYLFAQLSSPLRRAATVPVSAPPERLDEAVLKIARQHVVQAPVEIGGANAGPWVRHYTRSTTPMPWCAGFVTSVWCQAAVWCGIDAESQFTVSCDQIAHNAQSGGRFISGDGAREVLARRQDRAAVFLVRKSANDWHHTGIAFDFSAKGFRTIEGNTNDDGSREGVKACERFRPWSPTTDFAVFES